jgi:hypothetical protein
MRKIFEEENLFRGKSVKMPGEIFGLVVSLVTYTEGIPEFVPKIRIHSVYVKEASYNTRN